MAEPKPFAYITKNGHPGILTWTEVCVGGWEIGPLTISEIQAWEEAIVVINAAHDAAVKEAVEKAVMDARAQALDDAMMRIYEFRQGLKPAFYAEEVCYRNAEALIKGLIELDEKAAAIRARGKARKKALDELQKYDEEIGI